MVKPLVSLKASKHTFSEKNRDKIRMKGFHVRPSEEGQPSQELVNERNPFNPPKITKQVRKLNKERKVESEERKNDRKPDETEGLDQLTKKMRQEEWVGILGVKKNKILEKTGASKKYIYRKTQEGTKIYYYKENEMISSLSNKPNEYWIKVDHKRVEDQLLSNVQGKVVELVPKQKGGSQNFFNQAAE